MKQNIPKDCINSQKFLKNEFFLSHLTYCLIGEHPHISTPAHRHKGTKAHSLVTNSAHGRQEIALARSVKHWKYKILLAYRWNQHKQYHNCMPTNTGRFWDAPVGLDSRWPSVWVRGHPRERDGQRSGWQPAGYRQGSGSSGTHRPGHIQPDMVFQF